MEQNRYLHFIASFLIVLVLTIPFYTTSVYASVNSISVKGKDGFEGFAKEIDALTFNVQASIPGEKITNDHVIIGSSIIFDGCVPSLNNGSLCTLRFPSNGTEFFEARTLPFTINLYKLDGTLDDSKSGNVTIDNKGPEVKLTVSQNKFSSNQNEVVNYDVTDFACDDPSCSGKCIGVKNIQVYTQDGSFSKTIDLASINCSAKSSVTIDSKIFDDGLNSVFAKAADKFNQVSDETSVSFEINANAPEILTNSFAIMSRGISLKTFSSKPVPVDVVVNITGGDLNFDSVTADLSSLNSGAGLKNAKPVCVLAESTMNVCTWSINLNPKTGGLKTITINASDASGNKASATITKTLTIDNEGPVVQFISGPATKDGKLIVKLRGNTIVAAFDEATGLNPLDVFLGFDSVKIPADKCGKSDGIWGCVWNGVSFSPKTKSISIADFSTDVLKNPVIGATSIDITVDQNPPKLGSINISPVGGTSQAFAGFFKIGDKIAVVANVTEDNDVFAAADFSKFISGAANVAGDCQTIQADQHTCTWLTNSIDLQATDSITFNFSDNAGNNLVVTKSLKTYGVEKTAAPDFWSNTVTCSPTAIDRSLGPLINLKAFCTVKLASKSTSKPVSTVFIGPASCTGDTSILQKVDTFNNDAGADSPIIKLTLQRTDFKIDSAKLKCSFNIFSKIGSGTDITKNPEAEAANINLAFSNLPLGEVADATQKKIETAIEDANGIWKIIGTLNKIVFYAKKICQMISTIYNIVTILYIAYVAVKTVEVACTGTVVGEAFGVCNSFYGIAAQTGATTEASSTVSDAFKFANNYFCDYVTCKKTPLWGDAVKKWIDTSPGANYVGPSKDGTSTKQNYVSDRTIGTGTPRSLSSYMDPQHNLLVATLFACLPGMIYGLDKYRQIKCLYADCLINAVAKEGLPVTACEDQKSYATCKYITGEIFALIPWTALFDHFTGIIKSSLSNPFAALGIAVSVGCSGAFGLPRLPGLVGAWTCRGFRLFNLVGETANNVKDIIDNGFTIRQDYCARLEGIDKSSLTKAAAAG